MNPINSSADLVINDDVFASVAATAAMEIAGVAGLKTQISDIRNIFAKNAATTDGVRVSHKDGEISIDLYICVKKDARILEVAAAVQDNVKKTIQDMTNCAVTRVNVHVDDVEIPAETAEEK